MVQVVEGQKGLHFNKGKIGRFREAYNAEQQAILKGKDGCIFGTHGI
jgi:hypothetical protein